MRLGVVDYETSLIRSGQRPRTKMVGITIEGEPYKRCRTTAELMQYLGTKTDIRLYMHSDFEAKQAIVDNVIPDKIMLRGSKVIRCNLGGHQWINSHALFPDRLAKILKASGYEKKSLQATGHYLGCECEPCNRALEERNESDCSDALKAFLQLGSEYARECGINPMREGYATAASAAFAAAEKHAGTLPTRLDFREAYRGGRTEAYRLGFVGDADCWDINSSYPYSFLDLPEKDYLLQLEVKIKPDEGPSPFMLDNEREKGLLFPAGKFRTWVFASNLDRYYRPHGNIISMKKIQHSFVDLSWLKRVAPMVQRIYKKRSEGHPALKFALKIWINSIYGRIGLKPERTITGRGNSIPAGDIPYFRLGREDFIWFQKVYSKPRANYPLAAAITDNARARLYDMSRRVYTFYCDTDSIYCPKGTTFPVESSKELGGWKKEKSGALRIRTVKDYEFAGKVVRKGWHNDHGKVDDDEVEEDPKEKSGARFQWTVRLALDHDAPRRVEKTRKTEYSKRRVIAGQRTLPHIY